jgi:uncharacterized membrane protein
LVAGILRQNAGADPVPGLATETWTCPSCKRENATPYCASCGERRRDGRDLTLRGLFGQAFEALTSIDGRLLRSFRCLIAQPGVLTVAFLDGRRKPFLGPVALFLVANVLFFGAESLSGGIVFTTPLASHLEQQPWSGLAQTLVARELASHHTTAEAYAPRFDGAIALHARSLILLMVVAFTPLTAAVFRRSHRPFAAHAVFSFHLYAYLLLLFSIATAIPAAAVPFGGQRSLSRNLDTVLSIALLIACGVYLYRAIATVYGGGRASRAAAAVGLTAGVVVIVLGYRFVLMLITLYST